MRPGTADAADEPAQFVFSANPTLLQALHDAFQSDQDINVISVSGPPLSPRRFVALIPKSRAAALQRALGSNVTIVPDDPILPGAPATPSPTTGGPFR